MEEKARPFFLHCLTTLRWESSIRELQRVLSGSPPCIAWLCLVCGTKPWGGSFEALQLADLQGNTCPSPHVMLQVWAPRGPVLGQGRLPKSSL